MLVKTSGGSKRKSRMKADFAAEAGEFSKPAAEARLGGNLIQPVCSRAFTLPFP
jgi:hypothetical protein